MRPCQPIETYQSLLLPQMPAFPKSTENQTLLLLLVRLFKSPPCSCRQQSAAPTPEGSLPRSYTTVLREEVQSAGRGAGAWPSVGVSGPTRRVLLSMESSLSSEDGTESGSTGAGESGSSTSSPSPLAFIWLGTTETPLCPGGNNAEQK